MQKTAVKRFDFYKNLSRLLTELAVMRARDLRPGRSTWTTISSWKRWPPGESTARQGWCACWPAMLRFAREQSTVW